VEKLINFGGVIVKRIKFWVKCINIFWKDRGSKSCRAKWRRLAKEFQKASDKLGLK
jgi:hypothetical protein